MLGEAMNRRHSRRTGWAWLLAAAMLCAAPAAPATAPDYAREKKWAEEITPGIVVGDPVYITDGSGRRFLALYTEARNAKAAVILVHGAGVHPDWGPVGVLRSQLPDAGYSTLSVQMPVLAAAAKASKYRALFPEAAQRLEAAVGFLKSRGFTRIAMVSHSMGARMSNYYLVNREQIPVFAWVAIGIPSRFSESKRLTVPVYDLYGDRDLPKVLDHARKRASTVRRISGARQTAAPGADHFFTGKERDLVKYVQDFLDKTLTGGK